MRHKKSGKDTNLLCNDVQLSHFFFDFVIFSSKSSIFAE